MESPGQPSDPLLVQASSSRRISMHQSVFIAIQVMIRNILVSRCGGTDTGGAQQGSTTRNIDLYIRYRTVWFGISYWNMRWQFLNLVFTCFVGGTVVDGLAAVGNFKP